MSFIITNSGVRFYPARPRSHDILIGDIAHALSYLCRANGHFGSFFSVAQHSINCALEAQARGLSNSESLACLLHDASEAYISDITRPVKSMLPAYVDIEHALQNKIYSKFISRIPGESELKQISSIDDAMLYHEFLYFMGERLFKNAPKLLSSPDFEAHTFMETEREFLSLFEKLSSPSGAKAVQ